jgi:hypothetical protein
LGTFISPAEKKTLRQKLLTIVLNYNF